MAPGGCCWTQAAPPPAAAGFGPKGIGTGPERAFWHALFELNSAGQRFIDVGERTDVAALFARNRGRAVRFDMHAGEVRPVRRAVPQRVAASHALVGGLHVPFPALGRMKAAGRGDAFEPGPERRSGRVLGVWVAEIDSRAEASCRADA